MEYIEKIKKMLCKELEEYAEMGKMKSASDLDMIWKLTDTVKNLDKIEMLEDDGGYSEARGMRGRSYMHGSSYDDDMMYSERRGRGRYAKRDRMGRYSSDDGMSYDDYSEESSYRGSSYESGRYSRDDAQDHLMHKMGMMMEEADPKQRKILEEAMQKIRRV
jgi:hypothetical protein